MLVSLLFLLIGISIGGLVTWLFWIRKSHRHKEQMRQYALKVEELTSNYDDYRRKYLDLDDKYCELKSLEQTYRVAYQEWKAKYEGLKNDRSQNVTASSSSNKAEAPNDQQEKIDLEKKLEVAKKRLAQTSAQLDRQSEIIHLYNKQARRLERLESQILELLDHSKEIAIKSNLTERDPANPRLSDIDDM